MRESSTNNIVLPLTVIESKTKWLSIRPVKWNITLKFVKKKIKKHE